MNYEYKGIKIEFHQGTGRFSAVINGKNVTAGSLETIRARINKAESDIFERFGGISIESKGYRDEYKIVSFTVIGLGHSKRRHNDAAHFIVDRQQGYYPWTPSEVVLDTPENRAITEKIIAHKIETGRINDERSKQLDALEESLAKRSANPKNGVGIKATKNKRSS